MGKHWARQQVKHDEVHDAVDKGLLWLQDNNKTAATGAGVIAVVALVVVAVVYQLRSTRAAAWDRLSLAQSYAYSGRPDQALEQLKQLSSEQGSTEAAAFGTVFAGDLLFQRGRYKEASEHYQKVIDRGSPKALQPMALNDLALTQEASSQPLLAAQVAQRFLDTFPEHFLAPQVHACLARSLQAAGQAEQAKAALQKIAIQYADSSWAAWAQARLKGS